MRNAIAALLFCLRVSANNPPSLPSCAQGSFTPFTYHGCYSDSGPSLALALRSDLPGTSMTVQICTAFCKGNGYKYAGLEYYGECFCGASIQGSKIDESQCVDPCAGDKSQVCGGYNIVSVWEDPTFPVLSAPPNAAEDYQSLGCYSDSNSTGRALAWRQDQVDASNLTQLHCASACELGGYAYAGVEYGSECYCGMGLLDGSTQIDDSKCNINCTGSKIGTQCGGRSTIYVFFDADLNSYEPCSSVLPFSSSSSASHSLTISSVLGISSTASSSPTSPSLPVQPFSSSSTTGSSISVTSAPPTQPSSSSSSSLASLPATSSTPASSPLPSTQSTRSSPSSSLSFSVSSPAASSTPTSSLSSSTQASSTPSNLSSLPGPTCTSRPSDCPTLSSLLPACARNSCLSVLPILSSWSSKASSFSFANESTLSRSSLLELCDSDLFDPSCQCKGQPYQLALNQCISRSCGPDEADASLPAIETACNCLASAQNKSACSSTPPSSSEESSPAFTSASLQSTTTPGATAPTIPVLPSTPLSLSPSLQSTPSVTIPTLSSIFSYPNAVPTVSSPPNVSQSVPIASQTASCSPSSVPSISTLQSPKYVDYAYPTPISEISTSYSSLGICRGMTSSPVSSSFSSVDSIVFPPSPIYIPSPPPATTLISSFSTSLPRSSLPPSVGSLQSPVFISAPTVIGSPIVLPAIVLPTIVVPTIVLPPIASLCTSMITASATSQTCEYQCGSWCSWPIPTFNSQSLCLAAQGSCSIQSASCFASAGWPSSQSCWSFNAWCNALSEWCTVECPGPYCSDAQFEHYWPPARPSSVKSADSIVTSVFLCSATVQASTNPLPSLKPATTATSLIPIPTVCNVCIQPNNPSKGYSTAFPVGGIPLAVLTCSNNFAQYQAGQVFEIYNASNPALGTTYSRNRVNFGCTDACAQQYQSCLAVYAKSCQSGGQADSYVSAANKCYDQYTACFSDNKQLTGGNRCNAWNAGWY